MFRDKIYIDNKWIVLIAIFASFGFNMKPYFLLIFLFMEVAYLTQRKKMYTFIRIESLIVVFSFFFYILATYLFFNAFFEIALPKALSYSSNIFNHSLAKMFILNIDMLFVLPTFVLLLFFLKKGNLDIKVLIAVILATLFIYLYQKKGWHYHILPLFIYSLFAYSYLLLEYIKKKNQVYAIVLVPLIIFILFNNVYKSQYPELQNILKGLDSGSKIIIVTVDIAESQPLLVANNQIWSAYSPTVSMLIIAKINRDEKLKNKVVDRVFDDIKRSIPKYIIFPNFKKGFLYYTFFTKTNKNLNLYLREHYTVFINGNYKILTRRDR